MTGAERIVVITGAAGGVGRALVDAFHAEGAIIVAVDLPGADMAAITELDPRHMSLACDVSSEADIARLFAAIDDRFGRVDVLVNNAALGPTMASTLDTSLDSVRRALAVNLLGPFVLAREAARRMSPGGSIVNIASLAGVLANPRRNAYAASKAGLISLTRSLACEWAARGVRVTAVAPGYVRTPMVAALEQAGKADIAAVRRRIPMGRMARPDEIAAAARFLASPRARYVTGAVLVVDGGWMSFNQPGDAHPPAIAPPASEFEKPPARSAPRVALVTGGGRGIGEAIARAFAAAGDLIVVADVDLAGAEAVARSLGSDHLGLRCDVTVESDIEALFAEVRARYGRLDVLVNNAAIADGFAPALEQGAGDLQRVLEVNLVGAFACAREAARLMQRGGVILNLGSINTFLPFAPRHAYGASKAAIDILTRCMAAELGPSGLRTATLAPGYIRTPGVAALENKNKIDSNQIRRRIPLGDFGRPADIADAALFLASDEASYVNGAILYVDGGWTAFGASGDANGGLATEEPEAA